MNRRPQSLSISLAIQGFVQFKSAEGLSPRSIKAYEQHLKVWAEYCGDKEVRQITSQDILAYLSWLRTDYQPRRLSGKTHCLSNKTLRNIWVTLSSFFGWAQAEFNIPNPMQNVPAPRYQKAQIEPFSKEEVEALLRACEARVESRPSNRQAFTMQRSNTRRDKAILLVLLDTGLRASELCALRVGDVDNKTGKVQVRHGVTGGAKGGKGRTVFLGKATRRFLWRYLVEREDGSDSEAPLFTVKYNRPMGRDALRQMVDALGKKAEITRCHPHRFRHTFAITYLRSGGDVFTLQALLGHSSLDMVKHYAQVAEIDIEQMHRKASPVDNWRL
jgi:integrase/recombinase XerD